MEAMAGPGRIDDETPGWQSPGFFPILGRSVLYGVAGGAAVGGTYGGAVMVLLTVIAVISEGLDGLIVLGFFVLALTIGVVGGLLCGFGASLLIGVILGAALAASNLRGAAVPVVAGWARLIGGAIAALLTVVVMRNSTGYSLADFVVLAIVPAVIATTYGAWAGGRVVITSAIRDPDPDEGRLPA
jgi:hypothetical protein